MHPSADDLTPEQKRENRERENREFHFPQSLKHAPDLIGELRGYTQPARRNTHARNAPGFTATIPLAAGPVDDADDLYAALREHTGATADALGTRPPHTIGRNHAGERGLPAGTTPEAAFANARTLARFLEHQLPMIRDADLTADIKNDLGERWRDISRKYPPTAAPTHVNARCGNCTRLTIFKHPARSFGADETYVCENCGKWSTEREILERMAARQRELKPKRKSAACWSVFQCGSLKCFMPPSFSA